MKTIGVRELRQNASRYLRDAEAGETFQVTDRGRPVALLVPIPQGDRLSVLEAEGRLTRAVVDLLGLGPPLPANPDGPSASERLAELRADER